MTSSNPSDVSKSILRRQAQAVRRLAHQRQAGSAGPAIAGAFLDAVPWRTCPVIAGYWPMGEEADVRPLMTSLAEQGHCLCLPVVAQKDEPLRFRAWQPGQALERGPFGTWHPPSASPPATPALLLVPLLAFDRKGGRLGYGGGYYDRTLSRLRAQGPVTAVGIAYAAQELSFLPDEPHDQRLDWIVTEIAAEEALP